MDYKKGDRVKHKVFGSGTVRNLLPGVAVIQFDKLETLRNIRADYNGMTKLKGAAK